jgi:hypothetical protein
MTPFCIDDEDRGLVLAELPAEGDLPAVRRDGRTRVLPGDSNHPEAVALRAADGEAAGA